MRTKDPKLPKPPPEEPIRVWYDRNLIWCDGPQLSVLTAEGGQKYLSMNVDDLIHLCVPVSEKELSEDYADDLYNIHTVYNEATSFYTNSYEDFDSDTYLLRPIKREVIPKDWWPGK